MSDKAHPDINDTLRAEGPDAVRARHDKAKKFNSGNTAAPPLTLSDWLARDLPLPDFLLGAWLSTTSRVICNAPTGLGKTLLLMALAFAVAAGRDFLHWRGIRPARVLFIDGEMSRRLLKQRIADEANRSGERPAGLHFLSHEDVELPPLNTPEGRAIVEQMIRQRMDGNVDLVIFDNIMSLISGDMREEDSWRQTIPWVRDLTRRSIGQIWAHHTGHDDTRGYGTKTREWQMDVVQHMEVVERPDTDVSFHLKFPKARERTPATRADFADVKIALVADQWIAEGGAKATKGKVSPTGLKFFEALRNATIGNNPANKMHNCPTASLDDWKAESVKQSLLDRERDRSGNLKLTASARALFSNNKRELIVANRIACNETMAWILPS